MVGPESNGAIEAEDGILTRTTSLCLSASEAGLGEVAVSVGTRQADLGLPATGRHYRQATRQKKSPDQAGAFR